MLTMKVRAQVALVEVMEDCEETLNALGNGHPVTSLAQKEGLPNSNPSQDKLQLRTDFEFELL